MIIERKGGLGQMPLFDHERLEVHLLARQFNRELRPILEAIPRGWSDSRDNLKRAATSVTRNLAEGAGRWQPADKVHFYQIARASATECAATLDELVDHGLIQEARVRGPKEILFRVVAMLVGMIHSVEARQSEKPHEPRPARLSQP
jgi:four helix bundle protein